MEVAEAVDKGASFQPPEGLPTKITADGGAEVSPHARAAVALEFCAGSARLSASLRENGVVCLGIDHHTNRHDCMAPVVSIDLSTEDGHAHARRLLEAADPFYVHLAPPCGTASRARDIPLGKGKHGPRPLRSTTHPQGLPGLQGQDLARVEAANHIYRFVTEVCTHCLRRGIHCSVENPRGSYMWSLPAFGRLRAEGFKCVDFQACAHGSRRPKWTTWFTNSSIFDSLEAVCPGDHEHASWGVQCKDGTRSFATAEEAAYPALLCRRVARAVATAARERGLLLDGHSHQLARTAAAANRQTVKYPPAIPEFLEVRSIPAGGLQVGYVTHEAQPSFPAGFKVLDIRQPKGVKGGSSVAEVGVYRTPAQFVQVAENTAFPPDQQCGLPDELAVALFRQLVDGPRATARKMARCARRLVQLAASCKTENAACLASLEEGVAEVLASKRLHLMERLLAEVNHCDGELMNDIKKGFNLTGQVHSSGIFDADFKPAMMSPEDLKRQAVWVRHLALATTRSSGNDEVDAALWNETMKDVERGVLRGPFEPKDLDAMFPEGWVLNRRFPVIQAGGAKVRAIDDMSASMVNATVSTKEKLTLHGVDHVAALCRLMHTAWQKDDAVVIVLRNDQVLRGKLHPGWKTEGALDLVGTTFDLKAAYRQLAIAPAERWAGPICVFDPNKSGPSIFLPWALPFGAVTSVYSFNRAARALWTLGVRLMGVTWLNFYDDYPLVSFKALAAQSEKGVDVLLQVLGWAVSDKREPMKTAFNCLGVSFQFGPAESREFIVSNKEGRVEGIVDEVRRILKDDRCPQSVAAALVGRINFAESQLFGRFSKVGARALYECAARGGAGLRLPRVLWEALDWLSDFLPKVRPRRVDCSSQQRPLLVFTDGAVEGDVVTMGAVLFDPHCGKVHWFGEAVEPKLVKEWRLYIPSGKVIGQAELLPVLLARQTWANQLAGKKVHFFVDNEAARFGLIKGFSDSPPSRAILNAIASLPPPFPAATWVSRVPSSSNPADLPSRLDFAAMKDWPTAVRDRPCQPETLTLSPGRSVFVE